MPAPTRVVGRRVAAHLIDLLLGAAVFFGLFFALASERSLGQDLGNVYFELTLGDDRWAVTDGRAAGFYLLLAAGGFAYWGVLPGLTGLTLGKALLGIRVVGADGASPPGIPRNLLRELMRLADGFPYFVPGLTGFILALTTVGNRRAGDIVAGTWVVRRVAAGSPVAGPAPPLQA